MKKQNIFLFLSISSLLFSCTATGSTSSANSSQPTSTSSSVSGPIQLISDNKFERGFEVYPADRSLRNGDVPDNRWSLNADLKYGGNDKEKFAWTIRQAGDYYGLGDIYNKTTSNKPTYENGFYTFSDTSKSISINPTDGIFRYELNTSKEYEGPRVAYENWCHLLLEESLSSRIQISDVDELTLSLDCTLDKLEKHMSDTEYNPSLHTCQFLIYFVANTASSLDAGDFLWFGVPLYDYRYRVIDEYGAVDAGTSGNTGKFIYSMSTESYLPSGLEVGEKNSISVNMKTALATGLADAQSKGKLTHTTVDDLSIEYMNMGYEIPGTFDSAMSIGNLSLIATPKK